MGYDREGYETYDRPGALYLDGPPQAGVLYPGGGHRTWGHSKPPEPPYWQKFAAEPLGSEPAGSAEQRRRDKAEDKQRARNVERLHPIDPADPWSVAVWSSCEAGCPIHNNA